MNAITTINPSIAAHIAVIDGKPTTTTQDIAEVFGKRHDNVIAITRQRMTEAPEDWRLLNFKETSETVAMPNGGTRETAVIRMSKKGFAFVVQKFTGKKAVEFQLAYVDEFERMEMALLAQSQPVPQLTRVTITPEQKAALHAIIDRRVAGQDALRSSLWKRHNNHFNINSYHELLAVHFDDACKYLETLEIKPRRAERMQPDPAQKHPQLAAMGQKIMGAIREGNWSNHYWHVLDGMIDSLYENMSGKKGPKPTLPADSYFLTIHNVHEFNARLRSLNDLAYVIANRGDDVAAIFRKQCREMNQFLVQARPARA